MSELKGPDYKVWYRQQYMNNICHICRAIPENSIKCSNCKLVSYCGYEHLEDDLDDHEELCETLSTVAKHLNTEHALDKAYLLGADQLREFRLGIIGLCSKHLDRKLVPWEMEVCLFPPICATCNKFHPDELLSCKNCLYTKWCSIQHKPKNHDKFCQDLILYRKILQKRLHVVPSLALKQAPKSMNELLTKNDDQIEYCLLSEIATSPLTLLSAIPKQKVNENLNIHIIGAEPNFELNNLIKWEAFLLDLLPSTVTYIHLAFIGPEIGPLNKRTIEKGEQKLEFTFHQMLYHDYITSNNNNNTQPNLIAALNPGLYSVGGFQGKDTWPETISAMFQHPAIPVLITAYTEKEVLLDSKRIKKVINNVKVIVKPSINAYSSRRPLMNFVSDEVTPVVYKNAYYAIFTST